MRFIILLLFILATLTSQAQNSHNSYFDWEIWNLNQNPLADDLKGKVKEVKITNTYNKEKHTKAIERTYNSDGLITKNTVTNNKGEITSSNEVDYNAKGNVTRYERQSKNGRKKIEKINTYNANFRLIESKSVNSKGKIVTRSTWTYANNDCAISSVRFKKGGEKEYRIWSYDFYKDCDPSKTTLSNGKGKVIKTWTYGCKPEGEQLNKKKDETQICKWEESDGEYLIRVYQNFNEKGEITKQVQKYTIKDTFIVESIQYDANDNIKWKIEYDFSWDRQKLFVSYDNRGNERMRRVKLYVDSKLQSSVSFFKKKKTNEVFYTYNEKGWLTKVETFGKNDKKIKCAEYTYVL